MFKLFRKTKNNGETLLDKDDNVEFDYPKKDNTMQFNYPTKKNDIKEKMSLQKVEDESKKEKPNKKKEKKSNKDDDYEKKILLEKLKNMSDIKNKTDAEVIENRYKKHYAKLDEYKQKIENAIFNTMPTIEEIKKHAKGGSNRFYICYIKSYDMIGGIEKAQINKAKETYNVYRTENPCDIFIFHSNITFSLDDIRLSLSSDKDKDKEDIDVKNNTLSTKFLLNTYKKASIPVLGKPVIKGNHKNFKVYYEW